MNTNVSISKDLEDVLPTHRITNDPHQTSLEEYLNVSFNTLRIRCDGVYIQFSHRLKIYLHHLEIYTRKECKHLNDLLHYHYKNFTSLRSAYHHNPSEETKTQVLMRRTELAKMQDELYLKSRFLKKLHQGGYDEVADKHEKNMIRLYSEFNSHADANSSKAPVEDRIILARGVLRKIILEFKSFMLSAFPVWNRNRNVIHQSSCGEINHITDSRKFVDTTLKKEESLQNIIYVCKNCQRVSDIRKYSFRFERCPHCNIQTGLYDNIVDHDLLVHFTRSEMLSVDPGSILHKQRGQRSCRDDGNSRAGGDNRIGIWRRRGTSYKRLNHFKDCMKQVQGYTMAKVKAETLERVKRAMEFREMHISCLNPKMCRFILESIKDHRNYENSVSICRIVNPTFKPLCLTGEQEARLCLRFLMLESVFDRAKLVAASGRKNFLSYHFMFRRLYCMEKGADLDKMRESVRVLKSSRLLAIHESIWREMCRLLNWAYNELQT